MRLLVLRRPLLYRRSAGSPTPVTGTARGYREDPPVAQILLGLMLVGLAVLVALWYAL